MSTENRKRRAVVPDGKTGSFYDVYHEAISGNSPSGSRRSTTRPSRIRDCRLFCPYKMKRERVLDVIGIERDLQISLLVNLIPILGIASVLNHPLLFDTNTRILYYSAITDVEREGTCFFKRLWRYLRSLLRLKIYRISAVEYGIDVLIIWQLPPNRSIKRIDESINRITDALSHNENITSTIEDQQFLKDNNVISNIYWNIENEHEQKDLQSVCRLIEQMQKDEHVGYPVNYILKPKDTFWSLFSGETPTLIPFVSEFMDQIHEDVSKMKQLYDHIRRSWNRFMAENNYKTFQTKANEMRKIFDGFQTEYTHFTENLRNSIVFVREENERSAAKRQEILGDTTRVLSSLNESFNKFQKLKDRFSKILSYINQLEEEDMEFRSIDDYNFDQQENLQTIEDKLFESTPDGVFLCCSHNLLSKNQDEFYRLRNILVKERDLDRSLRLVYLDFTDSNIQLEKMLVFPSDIMEELESEESHAESTAEPMINVLLLGETGVGKSTFINALRNYIEFPSMDDALTKNNPIVVIPIFFIVTSGYHFTERIIKFGNVPNAENENFNKTGESVTQKCQEYIFAFSSENKQKIRFIDTPGFNDTRGLKQDQKNRRNILRYIRRFPQIDTICFLLKPNESRLTITFRSYFTAFAAILDKAGHRNVMFCFTNSRSTFYSPGNTGPLLRKFLSDLKPNAIPMGKHNVFCFDNESFRYFVARRNYVEFSTVEEEQYRQSWEKSCVESNRLIENIYRLSGSEERTKNESF